MIGLIIIAIMPVMIFIIICAIGLCYVTCGGEALGLEGSCLGWYWGGG